MPCASTAVTRCSTAPRDSARAHYAPSAFNGGDDACSAPQPSWRWLGREPDDLDVLAAWLHATVEGLTDDLCRLDQPMSPGLAVSLLHETVEIVVDHAGRRAS